MGKSNKGYCIRVDSMLESMNTVSQKGCGREHTATPHTQCSDWGWNRDVLRRQRAVLTEVNQKVEKEPSHFYLKRANLPNLV